MRPKCAQERTKKGKKDIKLKNVFGAVSACHKGQDYIKSKYVI